MPNGGTLIVAHKFLHHPDDDLVLYLTSKKKNVTHITHSFPEAKDRKSFIKIYEDGELKSVKETFDFIKYPLAIIYLKETFYTFYWAITSKKNFDTYIAMDGLCALWGVFLRNLGFCKKVVYWVVDFVPTNRFKNPVADFIYKRVNSFSYLTSDEVWDLSPRMAEAREKFWGISKSAYKKLLVVPYGVWTNRIKTVSYAECEKNSIVFMGHLLEKQGVQEIIKVLPTLLKSNPELNFYIIGKGSYREILISQAKALRVFDHCYFLDDFGNDKDAELENFIAKCCMALAPYVKSLDSWTYYADPGKIKKYIACGVPVVMTAISWNAEEISSKRCGVLVEDDFSNLVEKITSAMQPEENTNMRLNCLEYSKTFNYEKIFSSLNL